MKKKVQLREEKLDKTPCAYNYVILKYYSRTGHSRWSGVLGPEAKLGCEPAAGSPVG